MLWGEYRLKGLSCANCAKELEEQIQKLENGQEAKLYFNTSKLVINNDDMGKVEKILASDGAVLVKASEENNSGGHSHSHDHAHGHDHSHSHGTQLKLFLGISALLFRCDFP